jgi:hypothetical protein
MRKAYCGSVTFLQRAGGSINLNPHFHSLILDGVYVSSVPYEAPRFHPLPPPTDAEVARITAAIARRVEKLLVQYERRSFTVDALRCDRCGGRMRILAAIGQPDVIRGILNCLGLSSRAPPLTPAPSPEPTDLELGFEEPLQGDAPDDDG